MCDGDSHFFEDFCPVIDMLGEFACIYVHIQTCPYPECLRRRNCKCHICLDVCGCPHATKILQQRTKKKNDLRFLTNLILKQHRKSNEVKNNILDEFCDYCQQLLGLSKIVCPCKNMWYCSNKCQQKHFDAHVLSDERRRKWEMRTGDVD